MKVKEIRELIDFISQSGLNEVNIETEELKLSVKRDAEVKAQIIEQAAQAAPVQVTSVPPVTSAPQPPAEKPAVTEESKAAEPAPAAGNYVEIKSPMIGTFYRSANPDSPAFVSVGDKVEAGQPVCIVEAMKLFNEIESEVSGTIVKVMAENSSPVEYDQVLFLVDPA
ncbi:MAG: acetyl-CoA carboxylase biotin carboxyl carrier protein [Bacteroidota bacterium]